jgi:sporadic carbohydrate cluster protein (TIGR04323 family)
MKSLKGYVSSRPFMGERVAQHVQNTILRDYCNKIRAEYLLSGTEYAMENSFLMLNELVNEVPRVDGIVAFSLFQLPKEYNLRNNIYKNILMRKGELHFALEGLSIATDTDIKRIEDIWAVRQALSECPEKIRNTEKNE